MECKSPNCISRLDLIIWEFQEYEAGESREAKFVKGSCACPTRTSVADLTNYNIDLDRFEMASQGMDQNFLRKNCSEIDETIG